MSDNDNLVPEPELTIFDSIQKAVGSEQVARSVIQNPALAANLTADGSLDGCGCGGSCGCGDHEDNDAIELKAVDDIGRATAQDIKEALHGVIDPELGIDVVDLGLVYGIEIDELGRAIITMTLTTPACPLTDVIEDECASTLAGIVDEFRIDWTWQPLWSVKNITPAGREQLISLGFNLDAMPQ